VPSPNTISGDWLNLIEKFKYKNGINMKFSKIVYNLNKIMINEKTNYYDIIFP